MLLGIAIAYMAQSWIPAYGQAFMTWAYGFATTVGMQLRATCLQLRTVAQTSAAIVGGLAGGNVAFQMMTGSDTAGGDLVQSTLYSIDEIAISFLENKIAGGSGSRGFTGSTKGLLGKSFWAGFGYQTADTFGISPSSNFRQEGPNTWGVPSGGTYKNPVDPEPVYSRNIVHKAPRPVTESAGHSPTGVRCDKRLRLRGAVSCLDQPWDEQRGFDDVCLPTDGEQVPAASN